MAVLATMKAGHVLQEVEVTVEEREVCHNLPTVGNERKLTNSRVTGMLDTLQRTFLARMF